MPQLNVSIFNFYNIHSIQFFDFIQLFKNIYIKINQFSGGYGGYGGYGMGGWGMRRRMMMMGGCKFNRLEKKIQNTIFQILMEVMEATEWDMACTESRCLSTPPQFIASLSLYVK